MTKYLETSNVIGKENVLAISRIFTFGELIDYSNGSIIALLIFIIFQFYTFVVLIFSIYQAYRLKKYKIPSKCRSVLWVIICYFHSYITFPLVYFHTCLINSLMKKENTFIVSDSQINGLFIGFSIFSITWTFYLHWILNFYFRPKVKSSDPLCQKHDLALKIDTIGNLVLWLLMVFMENSDAKLWLIFILNFVFQVLATHYRFKTLPFYKPLYLKIDLYGTCANCLLSFISLSLGGS
jgi:hypothetical protein